MNLSKQSLEIDQDNEGLKDMQERIKEEVKW